MVRSASLSVGRRPGEAGSPFAPSADFVFSPDSLPESASFPSTPVRFTDPSSGDTRVRRASLEEASSQERVKGRREQQGFGKGKLLPQLGRVSGRSNSEPNLGELCTWFTRLCSSGMIVHLGETMGLISNFSLCCCLLLLLFVVVCCCCCCLFSCLWLLFVVVHVVVGGPAGIRRGIGKGNKGTFILGLSLL